MKTYRFSTFKELMETVPADRIRACLEELGVVLSVAKATADLLIGTAVELAARDGVKISKPAIAYPDVMEWVDDGKGTLEVNLDEMKNI